MQGRDYPEKWINYEWSKKIERRQDEVDHYTELEVVERRGGLDWQMLLSMWEEESGEMIRGNMGQTTISKMEKAKNQDEA